MRAVVAVFVIFVLCWLFGDKTLLQVAAKLDLEI
jgi:hypothetical protein